MMRQEEEEESWLTRDVGRPRLVREEIDGREQRLAVEQALQRRQVERLEREQQKLLQAHYADAIPLDLFKQEQQRIAHDMEAAQQVLEEKLGRPTRSSSNWRRSCCWPGTARSCTGRRRTGSGGR